MQPHNITVGNLLTKQKCIWPSQRKFFLKLQHQNHYYPLATTMHPDDAVTSMPSVCIACIQSEANNNIFILSDQHRHSYIPFVKVLQ